MVSVNQVPNRLADNRMSVTFDGVSRLAEEVPADSLFYLCFESHVLLTCSQGKNNSMRLFRSGKLGMT